MIKLNNKEISFALITLAYWFFMLTDGALRMLVLLHFHVLGYTPLQLAYLFLLCVLDDLICRLLSVLEQCVPEVDRKRVINHPRLHRL